jgi:phosphoadenosine phosphosulfate reductase
MDMSPLFRHANVALAFSGGKDSLALAHLLEPHWDKLTFYHVDAGDLLPEVKDIVAQYEEKVPRFVRLNSNSRDWMNMFGLPSDLVPHTGSQMGVQIGGDLRVVERYDCCGQNLWMPMHNRMVEDKVTLVVRGSKRADMKKLPAENIVGPLYELWLPLIDWSHTQVFQYLRAVGAPIAKVYEHVVNAPECATCPAWLDEKRARYLENYPALHAEYDAKLRAVARVVMPEVDRLKSELEVLDGYG